MSYGNLESENSQDYAWKPQRNWTFMNFVPGEEMLVLGFDFDLKVHKIENFFDSDFGICVISLIVMSKY
jgi:hypothetical protein